MLAILDLTDLTLFKYSLIKAYMNLIVTRAMMIQVTLMIAIKATASVIQSSIPGQEDVSTLARSSAGSVLKSAFIELLYSCAITYSCDLKQTTGKVLSKSRFPSFGVKHLL